MTSRDTDPYAQSDAVRRLREVGPIRTWSLLVTVFGDLAARKDAPLSGGFLNALFQTMGVKPEAVRVALHRLAKDGWVTSERTGRTSRYFMIETRLQEVERARPRVYGAHVPALEDWHAVIFDAPPGEIAVPHVRLNAGAIAVPATALSEVKGLALPIRAARLPGWLDALSLPDDLGDTLTGLSGFFRGFDPDATTGDPVERMAIRMLVLHHWRRLALRDGLWFHMDVKPDGLARQCQSEVLALLETLVPERDPVEVR